MRFGTSQWGTPNSWGSNPPPFLPIAYEEFLFGYGDFGAGLFGTEDQYSLPETPTIVIFTEG